jgi:hypothetical protein
MALGFFEDQKANICASDENRHPLISAIGRGEVNGCVYEWIWVNMNEYEWIWMNMSEYEWIWVNMNEYEWIW